MKENLEALIIGGKVYELREVGFGCTTSQCNECEFNHNTKKCYTFNRHCYNGKHFRFSQSLTDKLKKI